MIIGSDLSSRDSVKIDHKYHSFYLSHFTMDPKIFIGLFSYLSIYECEDMIVYEDCVLLKDFGDLPKNTNVHAICFDLFNHGDITFEFNGKEYSWKLDATVVNMGS